MFHHPWNNVPKDTDMMANRVEPDVTAPLFRPVNSLK